MKLTERKYQPNKGKSIRSAPILALGFLAIILGGAFLLSTPIAHTDGQWWGFMDSLFTSTSAVCVTGLAVVDTAVKFTVFGEIVILILIQIGGLGFMTGAVLIFLAIGKKITLHERMILQESISHYRLQGVVSVVNKMIVYTFVVELVGAILLMFSFVPTYGFWEGSYKSIFHSISAFCNAGFDILGTTLSQNLSLVPVADKPAVLIPIMGLIVMGGLGFVVVSEMCMKKPNRKLSLHSKVVLGMTSFLILGGFVVFMIFEWNGAFKDMTVGNKIVNALFQSITPRTAGFASVDQAALSNPSTILTNVLMFIGASPASTGGGIKTTTAFLLIYIAFSSVRGTKNITIARSNINDTMIRKSISVVIVAVLVLAITIFGISICEQYSEYASMMTIDNIVFESISAFSTVGLSKGITPYLSGGSQFFLSLAMFIGRVGTLTMGAAIARSIRTNVNVKYTDAKLLLG